MEEHLVASWLFPAHRTVVFAVPGLELFPSNPCAMTLHQPYNLAMHTSIFLHSGKSQK